MLILWIDPGIRRCGYAIINSETMAIIDAGVLINEKKSMESYNTYMINDNKIIDYTSSTQKKSDRNDRRMRISRMYDTYHQLLKIITPYQADIKVIGIEQFYFMTRTQQHAEFLYGLRWSLMMHAINVWWSLYDVGPTEMKKYITWRGGSKKKWIHAMVMALYQLTEQPKYADISDALGIAYVTSKMLT